MVKMNFSEQDIFDFVKNDSKYNLELEIEKSSLKLRKMESNIFKHVLNKRRIQSEINNRESLEELLKVLKQTNDSKELYNLQGKLNIRNKRNMCSDFSSNYSNLLIFNFGTIVNSRMNEFKDELSLEILNKENGTIYTLRVPKILYAGNDNDKEGLYLRNRGILYYQ